MKKSVVLLTLLSLLLMGAMVLKGRLVAPPDLRSEAAAGRFDAQRAAARLERILGDQRPHPVDSEANDAVRERLIAEMRAVGLQPQVSDDVACYGGKRVRGVSCARVRNVFATIGPSEGRHLLLASHYDSNPAGPGASDDGIGMAVMLEVAAQLRGRQLARPATFLFTDGEEAWLLGARAFLDGNPIAGRVEALLNFEARGVTGPAIMFDADRPNGAAIGHYSASVDRPAANSLTADFARLVPNTTDVEVFKAREWTTLNFAVIGNETRYHTAGDDLASLDRRSLQHMGDQALAIANRIAAGATAEARGEKAYTDLLGRALVVLPLWAALAGVALLLLLFAWLGWRQRGLGRAAAAVGAALGGSAAVSFLGQTAVGLFRDGQWWRAMPEVTGLAVYLSALLASIAALAWIARETDTGRLRAAFWLVFMVLGAALSIVVPGASIYFLLPPLVAAAGMLLERRLPGAERVAAIAAFLLLFLSWAPLLHLSEMLLGFASGWMFAPVATLILLPALIEAKPLIREDTGKAAFVGAAALAAGAWIVSGLLPAYSADRKQAFAIEYYWDENARKAHWLLLHDGAPLPQAMKAVAGPFRKGFKVPYATRKRWAAPASGRVEPPAVIKVAEQRLRTGRRVALRIEARGAEAVVLRAPPEAGLIAARAGASAQRFGKGEEDMPYFLTCRGRSCDGMVVELLIGHHRPVEIAVSGLRTGLPEQGAPLVAARPFTATPQYSPDLTVGTRRFRI